MNLTKKQIAKIIALLILITVLNFIFPIRSNATAIIKLTNGVLTKALGFSIISTTDAVNYLMSSLFLPPTAVVEELVEQADGTKTKVSENIEQKKVWEALNELNPANISNLAINAVLLSPDRIFNGDVALLDANIFKVDASDSIFSDWANKTSGTSLAAGLKKAVSNIYVVLRNISAVILLCLLIYTGIRILISNVNPYQQAEWKKSLIDWLKALCSLIFMHFLMIGIFYISDLIVDSLQASFGNMSITALIRKAFFEASIWDATESIICIIMYVYSTYLTIVFLIAYFKRLVWIIVLIIISPIVAVTQALGGKQKGIFGKWIKEYTFAVLLQPFHILIFYILVALPLSLTGVSSGSIDWLAQAKYEPIDYGIYFYALIAMSMIRPAEKFLYGLFGFNESQVAKQGTSESGVKVIKQVEKVVKDVAKTVVAVGAAVATGGASAAVSGAIPPTGTEGNGLPKPGDAGKAMLDVYDEGFGTPDYDYTERDSWARELNGYAPDESIERTPEAYMDSFKGAGNYTDEEIAKEYGYSNAKEMLEAGGFNDKQIDEYMNKQINDTKKLDKENQVNDRKELDKENMVATNAIINANQVNVDKADILGNNGTQSKNLEETDKHLEIDDKQLEIVDKEFEVSDEEFNKVIGEEKPKNKLMSRLEELGIAPELKAGFNYITSPEGLENLNNLRGDLGGLRDTMYLEEGPQEWNKGAFGVESVGKNIEAKKKGNVNAFVNNKNNINYMKEEHGLDEKGAKARLEAGAPYINKGITNVEVIDKLITAEQTTGKSPERTMLGVAKEQMHQVKVENVINDQSRISAVSQIIARQTGERVDSPRVQQEAKSTMEQARPYIEEGKTDPQILHRLVQLESNLKNHKIAAGSRTPQKVMQMDKIIDKAMKDGFKKIKLDVPQGSEGMKQIESAMNKELKDRISISAPKGGKQPAPKDTSKS